jgi:hypothetical protein
MKMTTQLAKTLEIRGTVEVHSEYDDEGKRGASYVVINLGTGQTVVGKYASKFEADGKAEQIRDIIETQIYATTNLIRAVAPDTY